MGLLEVVARFRLEETSSLSLHVSRRHSLSPFAPHSDLPLHLAASCTLCSPLSRVAIVAHPGKRSRTTLCACVRSRSSLENAGPRARRQEEGPSHVTVESVTCPYGAAVPSFRGRPCGAAACAPRRPLGSAREFQTFSCAPVLSPLSLHLYPHVTYLRSA